MNEEIEFRFSGRSKALAAGKASLLLSIAACTVDCDAGASAEKNVLPKSFYVDDGGGRWAGNWEINDENKLSYDIAKGWIDKVGSSGKLSNSVAQ